jgi:tRNA dimethylallyltransferase
MLNSNFKDRVYWSVYNIPFGKVCSYGQIALASGHPFAARQVGGMAHRGPSYLPWHRVVRSDGSIAGGFPGGASKQAQLLKEEGVSIDENFKINDLDKYFFNIASNLTVPIIFVVGETASGKTALGIELAQKYNGEIICADSWTVRRGMNIGTAKPTLEEQEKVRHHLIDVVDTNEYFSAGKFQKICMRKIQDIVDRGKIPFIVGGTGLYINSVLFGYSFLEKHDVELRAHLDQKNIQELIDYAAEHKITLGDIDMNNKRRIIRAIESGGITPGSFMGVRPNSLVLGIKQDRQILSKRITDRTEKMITDGLEEEVKSLMARFGWEEEAMKGIGYREWQLYFEGKEDLSRVRERLIKSNMNLAKRQRTWFKQNKYITWIDTIDEASDKVNSFLSEHS